MWTLEIQWKNANKTISVFPKIRCLNLVLQRTAKMLLKLFILKLAFHK